METGLALRDKFWRRTYQEYLQNTLKEQAHFREVKKNAAMGSLEYRSASVTLLALERDEIWIRDVLKRLEERA